MAKSKGGKENAITGGGIETPVEAFMQSNPLGTPSFKSTYGDHKKMGSEGAPCTAGGRGSKEKMRGSLYTGGRGGPK